MHCALVSPSVKDCIYYPLKIVRYPEHMMEMQIVWHIPRDSGSDCIRQFPVVLMLLALVFETADLCAELP